MLRPLLPLGPAHLLLQTVCREFVLEPAESPQTDKQSQINSDCIANATLAVCPSNHCFKLVWKNWRVCQTTPQTNMLRPFLPLGPAHLLLQTVCREFVVEPAGSPQTDKKSQINSSCIANATLAVCPSSRGYTGKLVCQTIPRLIKLIWRSG